MILEETTTIDASPTAIFGFFEDMDANYRRWHPDHEAFRWEEGSTLATGATATFTERIGGHRQEKTVRFTAVEPPRYLEFHPTGRLERLLLPHISFTIEPTADGSATTVRQRLRVRTGPIGAWLNRREFDAVREHMREEGRNLKRLLEPEAEDADVPKAGDEDEDGNADEDEDGDGNA